MIRQNMSRAAASLLRALIARGNACSDRILLIEARSEDWRSLTFEGERHVIALKVTGPEANETAMRILSGIEDAEFDLGASVLIDIGARRAPDTSIDSSILIHVEALTIIGD